MKFATFARKAYAAGLEVHEHNRGLHWMLRSKAWKVHFYPTTNRIFVNGMAGALKGDAEDAIRIALNGPPVARKAVERRRSYKGAKRWLLRRSQVCHWCHTRLTLETATLDHRIPIGRGGSDQRDNWVLACEPCNRARGCTVQPPPSSRRGGAS